MFPTVSPASTAAWKLLRDHQPELTATHIRELFQQDAGRFSSFSLTLGGILFDYSKNMLTGKTMQLLMQLAHECKLKEGIEAMFNGEKINATRTGLYYIPLCAISLVSR